MPRPTSRAIVERRIRARVEDWLVAVTLEKLEHDLFEQHAAELCSASHSDLSAAAAQRRRRTLVEKGSQAEAWLPVLPVSVRYRGGTFRCRSCPWNETVRRGCG